MSLTLYYHPLASFCHKVLIALYENDTPFAPHLVYLGDADSRAEFRRVWPIGKFPVLRDGSRDLVIPESTTIIEYLAQHYPGGSALIPADADAARDVRLKDRFYDSYVHLSMQKIVGDNLRPDGARDPHGVEQARTLLRTCYDMIETEMADRTWAMGESFGMADCAAAPALFYADKVMPTADRHPNVAAYLERLMQRPSYARVLAEAQPYFSMFPG